LHTSINSGLLAQINLDVKFIVKCGFVAWWKLIERDVSDATSLKKTLKGVRAVICPSKVIPLFPYFVLVFTSSHKRFIAHFNFFFPFTTSRTQ
jgi:hypothetical protein